MNPGQRCSATLDHIHGTTICRLPKGHEGKHIGRCEGCWDDGDRDPDLAWDRDGDDWT